MLTRRSHALALALFAALALVVLGPVLGAPTTRALGHGNNDVWNHVWGYWFVADSLGRGELPLHTTLLAWPKGGSLWFIDTFNAVLTLPVQWAAGPVAAYNAAIFLNLLLCGAGAYALALAVSGSWWGALFAGLAFMSAPHLLGQAYNGISETLAAGWLPLALLALRGLFREPGPRSGALAGLAMGVNAVANWYYGLFAGLALLGLLARELLRLGSRSNPAFRLRALAVAGGVAALVGAAVVAGPFSLFLESMNAEDAVVTRDPGFVWMTLIMHNMTDLLALVHPGKFYSPDLKAAFDEDLIVVVYLGAALLGAAALGLRREARTAAEPWALLALGYGLLSLGPFLYVDGRYVSAFGGWIPLPFLALFKWFPLFSRISHAYRFAVGTTLALSVVAAAGVAALERRRPVGGLVAALAVARIAESFFGSSAHFPVPAVEVRVPPVYAELQGGAVLELPITMPVLARSRTMVNQMVHGQPVPFGLNDPLPYALYVNRYTRAIVELERSAVGLLPPVLPSLDLAAGQAEIRDRGLRWIVVHRADYHPDQLTKVCHFLDLTATATFDDGELRVYRLD